MLSLYNQRKQKGFQFLKGIYNQRREKKEKNKQKEWTMKIIAQGSSSSSLHPTVPPTPPPSSSKVLQNFSKKEDRLN